MSIVTPVRFISRGGRLGRKVHAAKRLPSKWWVGVTWCEKRGEGISVMQEVSGEVTCRRCLRAMGGQ